MRAVIQRVQWAKVEVEGETVGSVGPGLCALVGVGIGDAEADAVWLARKVVLARIFEDDAGKMNRNVKDAGGAVLAISQFTLYGDLRSGLRPSFSGAASPELAQPLFELFCAQCRELGVEVQTGRFRTQMEVSLQNSGPVTLLLDSK